MAKMNDVKDPENKKKVRKSIFFTIQMLTDYSWSLPLKMTTMI